MKTSTKNFFFILFLTLGLVGNTFAQAPEGITYQAEARDVNGNPIRNQTLDVHIKIIQDDASGMVVWEGLHTVTTSEFGIFVLVIGQGTNNGGTIFEDIDWGNHSHFLNVQVKTKNSSTWIDMGTQQLLSVPYALHSKTAETVITETDPLFNAWDKSTGISITESQISDLDHFTTADETDPVYSAAPAASITDAGSGAVITGIERTKLMGIAEGAEVNVQSDWNEADNTNDSYIVNKPTNVSTFTNDAGYLTSEADGDPENEIQSLSINENILSLYLGGTPGTIDLSPYLDNTDAQKLSLNGKILSLDNSADVELNVDDADADPTNELITGFILNGNNVELSDAGGKRTIDLSSLEGDFSDGGDAAGADRSLGNTSNHALSLITNNANRLHIKNTGEIGIGTTIPGEMLEVAGTVYSTTGGFKFPDGTVQLTASTGGGGASEIDDLSDGKTGGYSVYLGANAGANDDHTGYLFNAAIGNDALSAITTGTLNTAMGYAALKFDTEGKFNVGIGSQALMYDTEGNYNVGIGSRAMENNTTGNNNVSIGTEANFWNEGGSQNTIIGYGAGHGNNRHSKSGNVFLGYQAGFSETGSNLLYIENSSSSSPLIWGDFSQNKIKINGSMEVTSSFKAWQIQLTSGAQNGYVLTSDASGNGSWQSFASSPWTVSGSDIYRFSGNVGIGTNQPSYRLDVNGNMRVNGSVRADKLLIPATDQYYSIAGCTFNPTSNNSYVYSRDINCIVINPNEAAGDADLVAPVHIPSGATLENISAKVLDNGPGTITVSLYLVAYNGGKFNLGSTNSSINSSSVQNLTGSLNSTVDNSNNAFVAVVRCQGTYSTSQYYKIYKVAIRYSISALP